MPQWGPGIPQINYIYEDLQGLLWFAAETGMLRFDPKTEEISRTYTKADGLPDNVVQCILPDAGGNLWLSTINGISRFDPRNNTFTNYHESDGLQSEQFNRKACFADVSGMMYFGGLHGFNLFDPRSIPSTPSRGDRVVLSELRLGGETVPVRPGSVLPKPIWQMDTLNLSYKQNAFSFAFAALAYEDQARTRYRFRLEGLEPRWTEVDSLNRNARYTGVQPGNYRFRVQASADDRNWNSEETSIAIFIASPWWATTWSRAAFVLSFLLLLAGAYNLRVRVMQQQQARLRKLVDERTAELAEAKKQAEQANLAKSAFMATMSHELRTPLNAILGFSGLLRDKAASDEQKRDLETINRSGEHLLALIDNVLDLAKIEAGRTELNMGRCDVRALAQDVADMIQVRAAAKGLTLTLIDDADAHTTVRADSLKLRAVLINLLGNAVKFTQQGSVTLRLSTHAIAGSERMLLRFDVEDSGIGIAPDDQERIFHPFEQVAQASIQAGTGLGLAICRQLVELMGGTISLRSEQGKGSHFRVELPVELMAEAVVSLPLTRGRVVGLEPGQPEYRVLVIEDEQANSAVLERLLRVVGFEVRVAADGQKGIDIFLEWSPQFIWMDLRMPVMDGFEATRRIRRLKDGSDVKIVGLSASGFESQRREALAAGLDDYLRKPFRSEELFEWMARLIGVRYQRAEPVNSPDLPTDTEILWDKVAALPENLREELQQAVVSLDISRISPVVSKIAERDPALAAVLALYVGRFAFTPILKAIQRGKDTTVAGI